MYWQRGVQESSLPRIHGARYTQSLYSFCSKMTIGRGRHCKRAAPQQRGRDWGGGGDRETETETGLEAAPDQLQLRVGWKWTGRGMRETCWMKKRPEIQPHLDQTHMEKDHRKNFPAFKARGGGWKQRQIAEKRLRITLYPRQGFRASQRTGTQTLSKRWVHLILLPWDSRFSTVL